MRGRSATGVSPPAATVRRPCCRPSIAAAAKLGVEKAICSDPELARLDREINSAYKAALASRDSKAGAKLRDQQRDFIAARNKSFGNPRYNLKHEMDARLDALRDTSANLSR